MANILGGIVGGLIGQDRVLAALENARRDALAKDAARRTDIYAAGQQFDEQLAVRQLRLREKADVQDRLRQTNQDAIANYANRVSIQGALQAQQQAAAEGPLRLQGLQSEITTAGAQVARLNAAGHLDEVNAKLLEKGLVDDAKTAKAASDLIDKHVSAAKARTLDALPLLEPVFHDYEARFGVRLSPVVRHNTAARLGIDLANGVDPDTAERNVRAVLDRHFHGATSVGSISSLPQDFNEEINRLLLGNTYSAAQGAQLPQLGGLAGVVGGQYPTVVAGAGNIGGALTGLADLAARGIAAPFVGADYSGFTAARNRTLGDYLNGRVGFLEAARNP